MTDLDGSAAPRFARLKDAFAASFAEGAELGARVAVAIDGEVLADLWGGWADRAGTRPFDHTLLAPVFSTGKAVMALLLAKAVDAGKLSYEQRVAELWPAFGQAGKAGVTVGQLLSHQAGLPGLFREVEPSFWYDREQVLRVLETLPPAWAPGAASGYHPITIGFLADEVFRRADGRSLARAVREDLAEPFGLELWWGLPDALHARTPEMWKPSAPPYLGELDEVRRAAFYSKGASPGRDSPEWRRAEFPAANLHSDARSLAVALSAVATGGRLAGREWLGGETLREAARERTFGPDKVLPFPISWGAGFMRNRGVKVYGPNDDAVGHSGWGGSCAFADPARRLSFAYVMNKQSPHLIGDPRPLRLIEAAYAAL
jgi:CubicO group peptidase (beta-lactamase class C family)